MSDAQPPELHYLIYEQLHRVWARAARAMHAHVEGATDIRDVQLLALDEDFRELVQLIGAEAAADHLEHDSGRSDSAGGGDRGHAPGGRPADEGG